MSIIERGEELQTAILFVDLEKSTEFASALTLEEYAKLVDEFHRIVEDQVEYYFHHYNKAFFDEGKICYECRIEGDEALIFIFGNASENNVYQAISFSLALKCAWLASNFNYERIRQGHLPLNLAVGIHHGTVWKTPEKKIGFAVNLAKRTESLSRTGTKYHIYLTDYAYKLICMKPPNIIFAERVQVEVKGVYGTVGFHEIRECFMGMKKRLAMSFHERYLRAAEFAISSQIFTPWIVSTYIEWKQREEDRVSEELFQIIQTTLRFDHCNPIAQIHLAEYYKERGDYASAEVVYQRIIETIPQFNWGWKSYIELLLLSGKEQLAHKVATQAKIWGVDEMDSRRSQG